MPRDAPVMNQTRGKVEEVAEEVFAVAMADPLKRREVKGWTALQCAAVDRTLGFVLPLH